MCQFIVMIFSCYGMLCPYHFMTMSFLLCHTMFCTLYIITCLYVVMFLKCWCKYNTSNIFYFILNFLVAELIEKMDIRIIICLPTYFICRPKYCIDSVSRCDEPQYCADNGYLENISYSPSNT